MLPMLAFAAVGAAAGMASSISSSKQNQRQIRQQRELEKQAYGYRQTYGDAMWNLQRTESLKALGIQRNRLAQALDFDVTGYNLGLEGQALQNQAARVQLADSTGLALAQQGASGTRGSDSLQRQIDFYEGQFARQEDLQGRGNYLELQNMAAQYSNAFGDIGRELESWNPGGYRYEAKSLADVYEEQMHGLRMKGYSQAHDNAQWGWLDLFAGAFGGAAAGGSFGQQVNTWRDNRQV